jgi:hypothetical protein
MTIDTHAVTPRVARGMFAHPVMESPLHKALIVAVAVVACRGRDPAPPRPEPPAAPPSRPEGLIATAHLSHPRATLETLGTAMESRLPVDFLLGLSLGVDVALLAAVDSARPIDVALVKAPEGGGSYVFAMTPPTSAHARSALAARYRFVHAEGLGDRVEPRGDPGLSDTRRRLPCALVTVQSAISTRVVCGADEATLLRAGRWVAFESAARASESEDFELTAQGEALQREVVPQLRRALGGLQSRLAADASAARREHARPPDYGDPEVMVALLGDVADEVAAGVGALTRASARVHVTTERTTLTVDLDTRGEDPSLFATDARERVGAPTEHPLAAMLPADAWWMFDHRGGGTRAALAPKITHAALRVLGDRVTDGTNARADLDALFAHSGDELAWAVARDGARGAELSLVLAQTDQGAGARSALARIARAPWLRTARLGAPLTVSAIPDGISLTQTSTPTPEAPRAPGAQPETPRVMVMGVRGGALVIVLGAHARNTLDGVAARVGGPVPSVIAEGAASVVGGLELGAIGTNEGRAQFSYAARRDGDVVRATLRIEAPTRLAGALRGLVQ